MILGALDPETQIVWFFFEFNRVGESDTWFKFLVEPDVLFYFAVIGFFLRFEDDSIESAKTVKQWNVKIISVRNLTPFLYAVMLKLSSRYD